MTTQTPVERVHTAQVDAPDGSVRLYAPDRPSDPWSAEVWRAGTAKAVTVAWSRTRGRPSRYVCTVHGLSHRRDACPHVIAALAAWAIYTERTTP